MLTKEHRVKLACGPILAMLVARSSLAFIKR